MSCYEISRTALDSFISGAEEISKSALFEDSQLIEEVSYPKVIVNEMNLHVSSKSDLVYVSVKDYCHDSFTIPILFGTVSYSYSSPKGKKVRNWNQFFAIRVGDLIKHQEKCFPNSMKVGDEGKEEKRYISAPDVQYNSTLKNVV